MSRLQHDFEAWKQDGGSATELSSAELRTATQIARTNYADEVYVNELGNQVWPTVTDALLASYLLSLIA